MSKRNPYKYKVGDAGKLVNGNPYRIICTDAITEDDKLPIIALVIQYNDKGETNGLENHQAYREDGRSVSNRLGFDDYDLTPPTE